MTLKPLDKHCYDLSQIIYRGDMASYYNKAAEWLHIASGIGGIAFDGAKFDDNIGYCGSADEYLFAESDLAQAFVQKLTVFTYIWLAIESLVDEIVPRLKGDEGKIREAIKFLGKHSTRPYCPDPSRYLLMNLHDILVDSGVDAYKPVVRRFSTYQTSDGSGLGLHVISKLRNLLAHGVLAFPLPDPENKPQSPLLQVPDLSSRIALLSIQELLRCIYKDLPDALRVAWLGLADYEDEEDLEDEDGVRIYEILGLVQLVPPAVPDPLLALKRRSLDEA